MQVVPADDDSDPDGNSLPDVPDSDSDAHAAGNRNSVPPDADAHSVPDVRDSDPDSPGNDAHADSARNDADSDTARFDADSYAHADGEPAS